MFKLRHIVIIQNKMRENFSRLVDISGFNRFAVSKTGKKKTGCFGSAAHPFLCLEGSLDGF
jgi:hypothetical protein